MPNNWFIAIPFVDQPEMLELGALPLLAQVNKPRKVVSLRFKVIAL